MRYSILLLSTLLAFGCSSKTAHQDDADVITRIGVISAKENASLNEIEQDSGSRTSAYGSVASGGSGGNVAIGVSVLLSSFLSSDSEPEVSIL